MDLIGTTAVVTGGGSGLGEAAARALAGAGAKVVIFDINETAASHVADDIGGYLCAVDICSDAGVDEAFSKARKALGQERILVNCAGIGSICKTASRDRETGAVKHFPSFEFDRIIQVNLVGTFRCIAKSAAGMLSLPPLEGGCRGVMVNTASIAAEDGQMGQAAYAASKGGIVGMTLPIARDLATEGVRVNTILPGIFGTPLMLAQPQDVQSSLAKIVPFPKRLGLPVEFASLVLEMVRNDYFNGEDVRLDGAIRMRSK
jgi:NAD(P)-dependent dehydrogenase (short-subunit alcohol dehydrogenase family)